MKTKDIYDTSTMNAQLKNREVPLGKVMVTPGIQDKVEPDEFLEALERHRNRDWGELCPEDWEANEQAILHGARLFSAHDSPSTGTRYWIITEADRCVTTGLLPSEY